MKDTRYSITYYNNEPISGREDKNLPAIFVPKRRDARQKRTAIEKKETINTAN